MIQDVIQYEFLFSGQTLDNKGILIIPLKIVGHTPDKLIERHCVTYYPELLISKAFSTEELKQRLLMIRDVRKMWKYNEDIFDFLQDTWFKFILYKSKIVSFEITDAACKWWNDKDNPHLELTINVMFDVNKMMDFYITKKYFWVTANKSKMLQENYNIKFLKPRPLLLTYIQSGAISKAIDVYIKNMLKDKNCLINKEISTKYKIKDFYTYKKTYRWVGIDEIKITIEDFWKMLKKRIGDNKAATAIGAYYTYKVLKRKANE